MSRRALSVTFPAAGSTQTIENQAGVIERVDLDDNRVVVRLTKEQIKNAPEYDADTYRSDEYRTRLGTYYSSAR